MRIFIGQRHSLIVIVQGPWLGGALSLQLTSVTCCHTDINGHLINVIRLTGHPRRALSNRIQHLSMIHLTMMLVSSIQWHRVDLLVLLDARTRAHLVAFKVARVTYH